jgi:hypothetical protein
MRYLNTAINMYFEDVEQHVNKLHFLKEVCFNGVVGEDAGSWSKGYYMRLSSGLGNILEEIANALDDYYAKMNEILDEDIKKDPTIKGWAAKEKEIQEECNKIWEKHKEKAFEEIEKVKAESLKVLKVVKKEAPETESS